MLKKFVALLGTFAVCTVLVCGLSGCGDKKPAEPATPAAPGTPPAGEGK